MFHTLQALACAAGLATAVVCAFLPDSPHAYEIRVTTFSGELFIAGSGDTCRDAWRNAVMPANVAAVICIQSN